ncbi:hypothetical protein ABTM52_19540, partial [Acinetobacter baumannii]
AYTDRIVTMRDGQIVSDEAVVHAADGSAPRRKVVLPEEAIAGGAVGGTLFARGTAFAFLWMVLDAAAHTLLSNRMRSALTMLGVFIGVAAL